MSEESQEPFLEYHYIAFIIDGVVQQILKSDPRFAAILLSEPTIIEVESDIVVQAGFTYNEQTNTFTSPNLIVQ